MASRGSILKISNRAISRLQAVIIVLIVVAAAAVGAFMSITPSGPTQITSSTSTSLTVLSADTITVETISQADTLDPAIDYEVRGQWVIQNVYETLLFFKGERADQVSPWLAESYDVSTDGLTYTFHLRSGITFTDGSPFDANAVYFSLMRVIIIDDPNGPGWMLHYLRGGSDYSKQYNNAGPSAPTGYGAKYTQGELDDLLNAKPVEVLDPQTVVLHLDEPYAAIPFIMATTTAEIVSPTAFKAHWTAPTDGTPYIEGATAGDYQNQFNPWPSMNMVGTGPYKLVSWDKASQTTILVRNEHYWGGPDNRGFAPVPNVIIKGVDNPNTRLLDFKSGTCDIIGIPVTITTQLPGATIFEFADKDIWFNQQRLVSTSPDFQLFPTEGLWKQVNTRGIGFNEKIKGSDLKPLAFQPFADSRIRQAFILAFNRTAYIHDVLQNFATPASQMLPPNVFGYNASIQPTPYDLNTATQLLLDAGANPIKPENAFGPKNTKSVEIAYGLGYSNDESAATILATAINRVAKQTGLYAEVVGLAQPQLSSLRYSGRLQVFFQGWIYDYVDPDNFLVPFSYSKGYYPPTIGYSDPHVDELIKEQARTIDPAQRLQLVNQVQEIVNNQFIWGWVNYAAAYSLSRSWIHERASASVPSGIEHYNPGIWGYYLFELEKGAGSAPQSLSPTFLAQLQLPSTASMEISKRGSRWS
jgi:peptide/nickel transport system substrate-binding protein